jgi:hypothetical protein
MKLTTLEQHPIAPKLYAINATQERLGGLGRTMVYRLITAGELQLVKIGTRSFITAESIDGYLARLSLGD